MKEGYELRIELSCTCGGKFETEEDVSQADDFRCNKCGRIFTRKEFERKAAKEHEKILRKGLQKLPKTLTITV